MLELAAVSDRLDMHQAGCSGNTIPVVKYFAVIARLTNVRKAYNKILFLTITIQARFAWHEQVI